MFIRPAAVTAVLDDGQTPRPAEKRMSTSNKMDKGALNGTPSKGSRQSVLGGLGRRTSVVDPALRKRGSINAGSPTPGGSGPLTARLAVGHAARTARLDAVADYLT